MKLEPGYYTAVVTTTETEAGPVKVQFGEASTGTKQVAVNFEIVGDTPFAGQTIMWFGYLSKDTVERTLQSLRYVGFKGDDISKINDQPLDQLVSLDIGENTYNDKTTLKVNWVNRHGGGKGFELKKPLAKADMAKFAATLKGYLKKTPEESGDKVSDLRNETVPSNNSTGGDLGNPDDIENKLNF